MKYKKLRNIILISITFISIIVVSALEYYNYTLREKILYDVSNEKLFILTKTIRNFEKNHLVLYTARFEEIVNDINFIKSLREQNSQSIKKALLPRYLSYKQETPSLEHLHIYKSDANLLFNFGEDLLTMTNDVVLQSYKTSKYETGYVNFNDNKENYYSIVFPIKDKNRTLGFLEFGMKSDSIFKLASKAGRYKYAIYLNDSKNQKKLGNKVASNSKLFNELPLTQEYIYKTANKNITIKHKDKYYLLHQYDIETYFQKDILQVLMLSNTTKYIKENKAALILTLELIGSIFLISIFLLYLILTKLITKLIYDEEQISINTKQMKIIMDSSDNLIVLLYHDEIVLANSTLLSFTNFSTLEDLKHAHNNLSLFFSQKEDTFSSPNAIDNLAWIQNILKLQERVVAIYHRRFGMNYFNVSISTPEESLNSKIIIFTNITSLYKKSKKDEYMATHDTLTKIYNRQYFNEALAKSIYSFTKDDEVYSLLMFDLDFFKRVNDTYGHQIGDDVLVQFAEIISSSSRDNDTFARWGGEEFVLLLKSTNTEKAFNVATHIKEKIKATDFNHIGTITCSVGVSQIQKNDNSESWLLRVDTALYKAKENGRDRVEVL